jgi:hypothetical protein
MNHPTRVHGVWLTLLTSLRCGFLRYHGFLRKVGCGTQLPRAIALLLRTFFQPALNMSLLVSAAVVTRMPSMAPLSEYVLEPLRQEAEFTLYRGRQHDNPTPVLAVALSAERPSPQSLRRLEHEY